MVTDRQQLRRDMLEHMAIDCWVGKDNQAIKPLTYYLDEHGMTNDNDHLVIDPIDGQLPTAHDLEKEIYPSEAVKNREVNQPIVASESPVVNNSDVIKKPHRIVQHKDSGDNDGDQAMAPFHIEAIHYGSWVLLVDTLYLENNPALQQLWIGICQALAGKVESLIFPMVTGLGIPTMSINPMNTLSLANASLAGLIFRMVKTKPVSLAKLTELPEGLYDERLVSVPTLEQMVRNPQLKRGLWALLSDT